MTRPPGRCRDACSPPVTHVNISTRSLLGRPHGLISASFIPAAAKRLLMQIITSSVARTEPRPCGIMHGHLSALVVFRNPMFEWRLI